MKVVGVGGMLCSGKDETANNLVRLLNLRSSPANWRRIGFADSLKQIFCSSFNWTLEVAEAWKRMDEVPPDLDCTVRRAWQIIGESFRQIKKDKWVQDALDVARAGASIVIADLRHPADEALAIRKSGGVNVLLWRPGFENNDPHPSEAQIKRVVDWCLRNEVPEGPMKKWLKVIAPLEDASYAEDEELVRQVHLFDYFLHNSGTKEDLAAKCEGSLVPFLENHFSKER